MPKLSEAVLWGVLAVGCFTYSNRSTAAEWIRVSVAWVGVLCAVAAVLAALSWISNVAVMRYEHWREAQTRTERVIVLETISRMTPEQAALAQVGGATVEVLAGEPAPIYTLRTPGGNVPYQFIERFIDAGGDDYLAPVRTWADGTRERAWAVALTNFFVLWGDAEQATGNKPAAWIDKKRALQRIGL